jgi:hypothetical protein
VDYLRGCRVIVADDKPSEAEPIIRALGLKGIPVAFFKVSQEDELPEVPCPLGVRLAILDIELGLSLTREEQRVAYLLQVLKQLLSRDNGPYMVVLWTHYPQYKQTFEEEIFKEGDLPRPVLTIALDKTKYGGDVKAIAAELKSELSKVSSFPILQFWEEASFHASTAVSNRLCEIADSRAANLRDWAIQWNTEVSRLVRAMASEEYGQGLADPSAALTAFYTSLNPLHGDRMEALSADAPQGLAANAAEALRAPECLPEQRAMVNSMLHLATEPAKRPWAGKVYALPEGRKWAHLPSSQELIAEFLDVKKEQGGDSQEDGQGTAVTELFGKCAPVLVELSPVCDYAQGKVRALRLLGGLLAPIGEKKRLKQPNDRQIGGFLWKLEQIYLSNGVPSAGIYDLYLSARFLFNFDLRDEGQLNAILRLRGQAFGALQAWFGAHAARQGIFLLRPER